MSETDEIDSTLHENDTRIMTNVWLLLASFAMFILPWLISKINSKINQYQENKPQCIIKCDDQLDKKHREKLLPLKKTLSNPYTENILNGHIKQTDNTVLSNSDSAVDINSNKSLEKNFSSSVNSTAFKSDPKNAEDLEASNKINFSLDEVLDEVVDSNNDTDTETITPESISSSKEEDFLTDTVQNNYFPHEIHFLSPNSDGNPLNEIEKLNHDIGIINDNTKDKQMAHIDDETNDNMNLATQVTIGLESSPLTTNSKSLGNTDFFPLDGQEVCSSPYVLRIDTGGENRDEVIHASPWVEDSDDDAKPTDIDTGGIYKATCVQLVDGDRITTLQPIMAENNYESQQFTSDGSLGKNAIESSEIGQEELNQMEAERRRIIANQIVRSRRIESWLHEGDEEEDEIHEEIRVDPASSEDAFLALPVYVQSEHINSQEEDEKQYFSIQEKGRQDFPINSGGTDSICSDTAFTLDMTSVVNDQTSSLEADFNSHEPDSLDFNEDPKIAENESDIERDLIVDNRNQMNINANELSKPVNSISNGEPFNGNTLSTSSWQEVHGNFIRETIVDREVRLALEREEEFRNELLAAGKKTGDNFTEISKTKNGEFTNGTVSSDNDNKRVPFKSKSGLDIRNRDTVFSMDNGFKTNGHSNNLGSENPLETMIQKEIRLQREREHALSQERQMAQMALHMRSQLTTKPLTENGIKSEWGGTANGKANRTEIHDVEDKIDHKYKEPQDICELELMELNSDSEASHEGSAFHHRTESLDSLGSAGTPTTGSSISSEPPIPKRQVKVKPLVDEDDEQPTYQVLKESPIEREIRLAREREETLRREKGLPSSNGTTSPVESLLATSSKKAATAAASSWVRSRTLDLFNPTEQRDVQRRLATSRIQQEIEEQTQRELALRAAGSIKTTSEENVDSKVTRLTDLIEKSSSKMSVGSPSLPSTPDSELTDASNITPPSPLNDQPSKTPNVNSNKTNTLPHQGCRMFTKSTSSLNTSTLVKRPMCGAGKGVMQKFIASRGKVIPSFSAPKERSISTSQLNMHSSGYESSREQLMNEIRAPPPRNFRRQCSAETKIQEELQQMKAREEELRLSRAKTFAMSQPNLLSIIDDEIRKEEETSNGFIQREKYSSNPNLLDDDTSDSSAPKMVPSKPPVTRKRSALIAQWEEKIQQNCEK